jgi:hypothetical protein
VALNQNLTTSKALSDSIQAYTALCAEIKPKFLLRAALSAALNKNFVPHALEKRCIFIRSGIG